MCEYTYYIYIYIYLYIHVYINDIGLFIWNYLETNTKRITNITNADSNERNLAIKPYLAR